ncbi:MAG: hypothetical protein ABJF09_12445 [Qipengyuania citrea]|uniref:hypothetical protein n=1 Tax=Alphaproteobacteria TaxID=28211 RepID=UPI001E292ADF|nr:hypothetical protein [Qipengyuania citrea]MCD1591229.1 hypothetical protein [Qipengyuania citrea]
MATDTIPFTPQRAKSATADAYWDGATFAEGMANEAERLSETAYALATSEAFEENAQHAFYSLAQLLEAMKRAAKDNEKRLTENCDKHREAAQ